MNQKELTKTFRMISLNPNGEIFLCKPWRPKGFLGPNQIWRLPIVVMRRIRPSFCRFVRHFEQNNLTFHVTGMHIKLHIQVNYDLIEFTSDLSVTFI